MTAVLSALLCAATLSVADFQARFSDTNRYVTVTYGGGFDLGRTPGRAQDPNVIDRTGRTACVTNVPAELYPRAYVLAERIGREKSVPAFTVRLTRFVSAPKSHHKGRSFQAFADSPCVVKDPFGSFFAEVTLQTGDICDLVFADRNGDFGHDYLDLELLGPTRGGQGPASVEVDPRKRSDIRVLAVALERPAADMEPVQIEPGNVFHDDERPEAAMRIRVRRPGSFTLSWEIADAEGRIVSRDARTVEKTRTVKVDLAQKLPGWYSIVWRLHENGRTLLTHHGSFALLGRDTRQTGRGELPYGCSGAWGRGTGHYRPNIIRDFDVGAKLLLKAGFRRSNVGDEREITRERLERYKLARQVCADLPRERKGCSDEILTARIQSRLERDPMVREAMLFHEHMPDPLAQAAELTGGTSALDPAGAARFVVATNESHFLRTRFPGVRIMLGNSLSSSEMVADLFRRGFPADGADWFGSESVVRFNLPERLTASSIQGADAFRELGKRFGCPWGVTACFEHDYRLTWLLGEDRQAAWYVRDLVLMQCWRFPTINIADLVTPGNAYAGSSWGDSGLCGRAPYVYPKKAYVALATATKCLDCVVGRRHVRTGDDGVRLVEFARADGSCVYAGWTMRGAADVSLDFSADVQAVDLYGRPISCAAGAHVRLGEAMTYFVSAGGPCLKSVNVLRTVHDDAPEPTDYVAAVRPCENVTWTAIKDEMPEMSRPQNVFPKRRVGSGSIRTVSDNERGKAWELSLEGMDAVPFVASYTVFLLDKPAPLGGHPKAVGAWIKGNAGMGEVYFVVEDARGRISVSSGRPNIREFDPEGRLTVCFSGWRFVSVPLTNWSREKSLAGGNNGFYWSGDAFHGDSYPLRLRGVVFCAESCPLLLDERSRKRQVIRVASIGGFDG